MSFNKGANEIKELRRHSKSHIQVRLKRLDLCWTDSYILPLFVLFLLLPVSQRAVFLFQHHNSSSTPPSCLDCCNSWHSWSSCPQLIAHPIHALQLLPPISSKIEAVMSCCFWPKPGLSSIMVQALKIKHIPRHSPPPSSPSFSWTFRSSPLLLSLCRYNSLFGMPLSPSLTFTLPLILQEPVQMSASLRSFPWRPALPRWFTFPYLDSDGAKCSHKFYFFLGLFVLIPVTELGAPQKPGLCHRHLSVLRAQHGVGSRIDAGWVRALRRWCWALPCSKLGASLKPLALLNPHAPATQAFSGSLNTPGLCLPLHQPFPPVCLGLAPLYSLGLSSD